MTQNSSGIQQINLGYNEQEDRLLLKLGLADKTEVVIWISRRVCKAMWALLQNTSANLAPTAAIINTPVVDADTKSKAIESFEKEAAEQKVIENMDFKSEYIAGRQARTDEPLLAVQCLMISVENVAPNLELICKHGESVKVALNTEIVHAMTNMMQLATREAGWDLLFSADQTQVVAKTTQQLLH